MKRIVAALSLFMMLAGVGGVLLKVNSNVARASDVAAVSARVETHILEDELRTITNKMWAIEDRWTGEFFKRHERYPENLIELLASMPQEHRDTYRELEKRKAAVEAKLKKLRGD